MNHNLLRVDVALSIAWPTLLSRRDLQTKESPVRVDDLIPASTSFRHSIRCCRMQYRCVIRNAVIRLTSERKQSFPAEQVPVSAYGGSLKNLKDLKDVGIGASTRTGQVLYHEESQTGTD